MKLQEVTSQLRAPGTTQNIKTYRRHGADDNVYGVSFADLKTMATKIRVSKHAMNAAVIAIGVHKPKLTDTAIQSAINIGTVKVDHGDTPCKTPDAAAYFKKSVAAKKPKLKTTVPDG